MSRVMGDEGRMRVNFQANFAKPFEKELEFNDQQ